MDLILANVGTALMFTQAVHLLYGNALIGVLEGVLIGVVFKGRMGRAIPIMILANYVSMAAGVGVEILISENMPRDWAAHQLIMEHVRFIQIAMAVGVFVLTILIEWPFCRWIMRKVPQANKKAWKADVIAQVASYALLVPLYFGASQTSLATEFTLHEDVAFVRPPIATVYYINPDDGDVWRIQTDGTGRERILEADIQSHGPLAFSLAEDGQSWDLYLEQRPAPYGGDQTLVASAFAKGRSCDYMSARMMRWGGPDLRGETDPAWWTWCDFWGAIVVFSRDNPHESFRLAFHVPWLRTLVLSPTVLSSEQVVFELEGYIMLLDLQTRDLGVLTKGRGPAVIEPGEMFNTWVDPRLKEESPEAKTAFPTTAPAPEKTEAAS